MTREQVVIEVTKVLNELQNINSNYLKAEAIVNKLDSLATQSLNKESDYEAI